MQELIERYIESKRLAWAPTTLRSERHRLLGLASQITGEPDTLWTALSAYKPYSRVTYWTRVVMFWQWLLDQGLKSGRNEYESFRKENLRLFKHTYQPHFPSLSFEEAVKAISGLDQEPRRLALQILGSGERFHESIQAGNEISGKGSKRRHSFRPIHDGTGHHPVSYGSLRKALATIGLRPHDLRKLCASRLVQEGLKEQDLLKVMGWTSMETAKFYLAPKRDAELQTVFNRIHKELV